MMEQNGYGCLKKVTLRIDTIKGVCIKRPATNVKQIKMETKS